MFTIMPMAKIAILAGAVVGSGALGYKLGNNAADVECLENVRDTAIKYAEGWQASVEKVQAEVNKQSKRDIENAKRQATIAARQVRQREEYDLSLQNRTECRMSDSAFFLLNEAIDTANSSLGYTK